MEQRNAHPLDIDLLELVLGDPDVAPEITDHLGTCLLCRIRIARLRRSGSLPGDSDLGLAVAVAPEILGLLDEDVQPAPAHGQLWLAGDERRMFIWIRKILDSDTVIGHAATEDLHAADHTFLITDPVDKLRVPLAIGATIAGTIKTTKLFRYITDLPISHEIELLRDAARTGLPAEGVTTGSPVEGLTDDRIEFHQLLADDLADLDPFVDDDPDNGTDDDDYPYVSPKQRILDRLFDDLSSWRGLGCQVEPADDLMLGQFAQRYDCVPVAKVYELDTSVLLISASDRVQWVSDNAVEARTLLRVAKASTLAVTEATDPFVTCVLDHRDLQHAFQTPNATSRSAPRIFWDPAPVSEALHKFFENAVFRVAVPDPLSGVPTAPSLSGYLQGHARVRIDEIRELGAQMTKRTAFKSLDDGDADAVSTAVLDAGGLAEVLDQIDRIASE